jgi:hypothetical protein
LNSRRGVIATLLVMATAVVVVVVVLSSRDPAAPPAPAPAGGGAPDTGCQRPYADASPWNTLIGAKPAYHPRSARFVARMRAPLTSDPTQYTYPVYAVAPDAPLQSVRVTGAFSDVTSQRTLTIRRGGTVRLPIPQGAEGAAGSDAQIVLVNRATGDEWGAWRLRRTGGGWQITNGYHYSTRWSGVPPRDRDGNPFGSRGAGVPYLAGLVRPCEITRGRIDHALAFAYDAPAPSHVYPATKSDGAGSAGLDVPEGTRLQLNPKLTVAHIKGYGCDGPCLTIARALQRYGMYTIDNSGRSKVILEYEDTARWNGLVDARTVSPIPLSAFRVLRAPRGSAAGGASADDGAPGRRCTIVGTPGDDRLTGRGDDDVICGLAGDDRLAGGPGDDVLLGGAGADDLSGGAGRDRLLGEGGPDRLDGGPGRDVLSGAEDHDVLLARDDERDTVDGGPGSDRATVDRGRDVLTSIFKVEAR